MIAELQGTSSNLPVQTVERESVPTVELIKQAEALMEANQMNNNNSQDQPV